MAFNDSDRKRASELIARYPHKKSAILPLLHLAQDRDGWVTPHAMREIADLLDLTPALVLGTCSFYTMFKREPVGDLLVSVCTNVSCIVNGGLPLLEELRERYLDDADVTVEEVECIAACDLAPVMQVNYEFHGPVTAAAAADVIESYRRGDLTARTMSGTPTWDPVAPAGVAAPTAVKKRPPPKRATAKKASTTTKRAPRKRPGSDA